MQSSEIRKRFLAFFEKRGHAVIPSASLIPEGDSSTLFTTAGMQPLVPYLLGQRHPLGKRLVNIQKCVRTGDIEEVGDSTHLTFFEMLGNWSLGDYFKKESIAWSYEFLTSTKEGLGLDPRRLYITVFEGDNNAPRDTESVEIWKSVGIPEHRIYFKGVDDNWWSPGDNGPCGPDTEIFYDLTSQGLGDLTLESFNDADRRKDVVEIWNNVFIEYEKKDGKVIGKLAQKSVDTGMGLERITAIMQNVSSVYETDLFIPIIEVIQKLSAVRDTRLERIIADHVRASTFIIADGIQPSNTNQGYVLRRLIRRAVRFANTLGLSAGGILGTLGFSVINIYKNLYFDSERDFEGIPVIIGDEDLRFRQTIQKGLQEIEKVTGDISGQQAFYLYQSHGFPIEMTREIANERGVSVDIEGFEKELEKHQSLSRLGAEQKFKGGLGDHSEQTVKLHTTHHLLLAALQQVLGKTVKQRGSNITPERLRLDFSFDRKLTPEELAQVEIVVNEKIQQGLTVVRREMPKTEAEYVGAEMEFGAKYPNIVSVYFIEDSTGIAFSKEFCGGPHVANTKELGHFKIIKEEAVSAGVRRIKAVLE